MEPQTMSPGSIMPSYPWLFDNKIDTSLTPKMIRAMQTLGVPYEKGYDAQANTDLLAQANSIRINMKMDKIVVEKDKEIVALVAYLQRLGKDIKNAPNPAAATPKAE
jgi:cytochrome c oxidase cbb3-type subunit I/II